MQKTNIVSVTEKPYTDVEWLGLVFSEDARMQRHVGFLYRVDEDADPKICELRFHNDLYNGPTRGGLYWVNVNLDQVSKISIASWLEASLADQTNMPYGFSWDGEIFNSQTGEIIPPPLGNGLTCATFVLAVFDCLSLPLVKVDSWQIREDDIQWQQSFLEIMEEKGVPEAHINELRDNVPATRIRPEEVVGAALLESECWPVTFEEAKEQAILILQDIQVMKNKNRYP